MAFAYEKFHSGVEPLTPEDIAEIIVFAAGRRQNVVLADSLVFPSHQVWSSSANLTLYPLTSHKASATFVHRKL
jgi:hypothetical protein